MDTARAPARIDAAERWSADEARAHQRSRLAPMLAEVLTTNSFYRRKLADAGIGDAREIHADDWARVPFTTKAQLSEDQAARPPWGTNLTYSLERYVRLHQTSGTTGEPLRVLDTAESWAWWAAIWERVYRAAGVSAADRVFFCFSFGPFVGFWSAFAGAERIGALCLSGGAQSSGERLAAIRATGATALLCTPTYALRLAEVAREEGLDPRGSLRVSIHAGEPGASIPATRERIESALGVTAYDHTGATEVGPTGFSCEARDGVHLVESEFLAEIVDPASSASAPEVIEPTADAAAVEGELVLTNLGRWGWPVIRYRTGDRVRAKRSLCACGRTWLKLEGGILGRVDEMITVRGVNVFPSVLEGIVRGFAEVAEFRIEVYEARGMQAVRCTVEPAGAAGDLAGRVATAIHAALGIRCEVAVAAPGSLPRFELKARRLVRAGSSPTPGPSDPR